MSEQVDNSFKNSSLNIIEFSMEQDVENNQNEQEIEQNENIQKNKKHFTPSKDNKIQIHESQDLKIIQFNEDNEIIVEHQQQKHHLNEINANYEEEQSEKIKNTKLNNSFQPIQQQVAHQQIIPQEPTEENPDLNQHDQQFCNFKVTMVAEDHEQVQLQNQNHEQNNLNVNKQNQFQEQNQIYSQQQELQRMIPDQIYQPDNQYYPQQNQQFYQQNQYNQNNVPIQQYPDQPYPIQQYSDCQYPIQQYPEQEEQQQQQQFNGKNKKNRKQNRLDRINQNSNQNKNNKHQEQTNSYQNRNMIIIPITSAQEEEQDKDSQSRGGYNGGVHFVSNTTTFCCFQIFDTRDNCCQWICDCIVKSLTFPIILMKMLIQWIWNCCLHGCCDFFCPDIDKCCAEGCNLIVFSVSRFCRYLNKSIDGCCQLSIKYVFQCINCAAITQFFLVCCDSCAKQIETFFSVICYAIFVCFQLMGDKILVCLEVLCSAMGECLGAICGLIGKYMDFCCKFFCGICGCMLNMLFQF